VRTHPLADPGTPDLRSPWRFLLRVLALQRRTVLGGAFFGIAWMSSQAMFPFLIGRAIDQGVAAHDLVALRNWCLVLLAVGILQSLAGLLRHRCAVSNYLTSSYRTQQWLIRHTVHLGASLRTQLSTGDVVSVGTTDTTAIARGVDITARLSGAVVTFVLVAVLLLTASPTLGLVIVIGVPAFSLVLGPLLRPLHARQAGQRAEVGELTSLGADTVAGLRVLRGIGGEEAFVARYREQSQRVRTTGIEVARSQSLLDATQVLVPGTFVVLVTWLGARFAVEGRITPGQLVSFYGYSAFLLTPLRTLTEAVDKVTRAVVGARRMINVLSVQRTLDEPALPAIEPPAGVLLVDPSSGLVVEPGLLTAVACGDPEDATALADRLGRYVDSDVLLGGVRLADLATATVRRRVLVADKTPVLFSGRLGDELGRSDATVAAAVTTASADDLVDALPEGLSTDVDEGARAFSGGERQRLLLARALAADPDVLVLDEPTSAVDAHTEARIGAQLRAARRGRTTVVLTTSPLLLGQADRVALLVGGRIVGEGRHGDLLRTVPTYAALVLRGETETLPA
jgi:ABC-type multidrug transport system fused ATPase/permease subunit